MEEISYTLKEVHTITTWFEVPSSIYEYCMDTCSSVEDRKIKLLHVCYVYFDQVMLKKETEFNEEEIKVDSETVKLYALLCLLILKGMLKHSCSYYEQRPNSITNILTVLKQVAK